MNDKDILEVIADSLEVEVGDLTPSLTLNIDDNWDSIAHLSIITSADRRLGIELNVNKLADCKCVEDLYNFLSSSRTS